ncbi:hypothetical protein [Nonomuraea endophytica]|uniref:hypothetical protein n=1 Tax=Nonomuraea endophytica TaxID=714136 RepID=UPI0037CA806F
MRTRTVWECHSCGSADVQVTRSPRLTEAWQWLKYGGRWRSEEGICRACGAPVSPGMQFGLSGSLPWWRTVVKVPAAVVGVLHRRRRVTPTPIAYLVPALAATVVGLVAQWVWGWSWWLFPLVVVAGLWLLYLSTGFRHPGRSRPLSRELLDVVAPGGRLRRQQEEEEQEFRTAPFPLYGLPLSWPGLRYTAGRSQSWSAGEPVRLELELGHGDPQDGTRLNVAVTDRPSDPYEVRQAAEELWESAQEDGPRWFRAVGDRPDPVWAQVTIPVDGEPQVFGYLSEGSCWVARAELLAYTIVVKGRVWPVESVELVRVERLEPYLAGRRQLDEAHRSASS